MKKRFSIAALLLILVLLLTACGRNDIEAKIQGTWNLVDAVSSDTSAEDIASSLAMIKEMGGSLTLTFDEKKMTMNMEFMGQTESSEMTYAVKDGKISTEDGTVLDVKFDGDKAILSEGENSLTLQKQK